MAQSLSESLFLLAGVLPSGSKGPARGTGPVHPCFRILSWGFGS